MTIIQTATGGVEDTELGVTLSHEHVFLSTPGLARQYPWLFDRETAIEHVVGELRDAHAVGVRSMIDVTTPDLGRDIERVKEAAQRSGVNVIAATGIWLNPVISILGGQLGWFQDASVDEIMDVFVREIEVGIADSNVRAGVIKVANTEPPGVGELQEKILRAAARTAIRTSVPITTHTTPYDIGREQMRIFDDEGVPRHLVTMGHAFTDDLDYLHEVLEGGRYISVDYFNVGSAGVDPELEGLLTELRKLEPQVVKAIAQLCQEGYADHIMLGHDYFPGGFDWQPHRTYGSTIGWTYVPTRVRPALVELGVSEDDLTAMLVTAPARLLAGERDV